MAPLRSSPQEPRLLNPFTDFPDAVAGGTCAVCGERPGTLRVVASDGVQRRAAMVCEPCASRLMAAQGGAPTAAQAAHAAAAVQDPRARRVRPRPDRRRGGRPDRSRSSAARTEIEQTVEILARRRKNNAVLIGEAGVGKTAIVEGLARRIAEGDVPDTLLGVRRRRARPRRHGRRRAVPRPVRGAAEEGARRGRRGRGPRSSCSSTSSTRSSAPATPRARWTPPTCSSRCSRAASCAWSAPRRWPSSARSSATAPWRAASRPVTVEEPSVDETVEILRGLRAAYEEHHGTEITDEALLAAARLSDRYITEYRLPDKAIDLVDQAAAKVRLRTGGRGDAEKLHRRARPARRREAGRGRRRGVRGGRPDQGRTSSGSSSGSPTPASAATRPWSARPTSPP